MSAKDRLLEALAKDREERERRLAEGEMNRIRPFPVVGQLDSDGVEEIEFEGGAPVSPGGGTAPISRPPMVHRAGDIMSASAALTLYVPPETRLALVRRSAPVPDATPLTVAVSPFRFDVGQVVVAAQKSYSLERAFWGLPAETYTFQTARIVARQQRAGELWYTLNVEMRVGATARAFNTFPVMKREAELGASFHEIYTRLVWGKPAAMRKAAKAVAEVRLGYGFAA